MSVKWGIKGFKGDARKCYEEIQTLGEDFTPRDVLELARDPRTELHKCFDWDDTIAAEKWRLHQARQICGSISVVVEHEEQAPVEYRLIEHDSSTMSYRPIVFTVRNEDQYGQLLRQAKRELDAFQRRYKIIKELKNVIEEIEKVINN